MINDTMNFIIDNNIQGKSWLFRLVRNLSLSPTLEKGSAAGFLKI